MLLFPEHGCRKARSSMLNFHDEILLDESVDSFVEEELSPINGLRSAPYKFELVGKSDGVIDLMRTQMEMRLKIVKPDGTGVAIAAGDKGVSKNLNLVGNPISSMWSRIDTALNDTIINVDSSRNVAHKGIIEDWIRTRLDHRAAPQGIKVKRILSTAQFQNTYKDEEGKFNEAKTVQYVGEVPVDFLKVNNFLAPRSTLTLTFHPRPDDWVILHAQQENLRVKIVDLKLHIRRIHLTPELIPRVPQLGQDTKELYCGKFAVVKDYQIPKGALRWRQNIILGNGKLPKYVILGMVAAESFAGKAKNDRDPCFFNHFNVNHVSLKAGEKTLPKIPYSPLRSGTNHGGMREYYALFDQLGLVHHFVDTAQHAQGSNLFPFNLTADMRSYLSTDLLATRRGPLSADLGFSTALTETIVLIAYLVYDQVISVTGSSGTPIEEQF